MEGFPSGQRGRTVNPLAQLSKVRILLPPSYCRGVEQLVARRAHNPKVAGSSPVPATTKIHSEMIVHCAGVAQSAERILGKDKVTGSIPVTSSIHGGIAQLARAIGSYPVCPRFKSVCRHH